MRAFWGSNQERVSARADLFSMQLNFGQPSIFFTISPSTSSSFRIANLAGEIDDASLDALQQCLDSSLQFSKAKLGEIATANPFVCAKYFDQLMCILISDVFDWDCEKGSSGTKGGIFGHTKAFFAATESQSSTGSLHAHILIWIDGLPTTARAYYELLKNEHLKNQMLRCELSNLTGLPFTQQAFRKPKRQALRPSTSICTGCESTFGSSEVIDESLKLVESRHQDSFAKLHDNFVFQRIAAPLPFPRTGGQMYSAAISRDALITAKALLSYQHHLWSHTKGCFKVTKRTPDGSTCRMFFPKEACPQTHWTEEDRIELKRDPGNEYINAYVPLINDIFKTNHDIKVLAAGEGPEKAYYTIKYTAKPQLNLENPLALHLTAFGKAKDSYIFEV
ncbi:Hypothetical protein PHPALM_15056 [Phytophthora palmivora]|uniref:Helitron helicase-like domain-containing protein n=1 Tax=Phytophthora palmivora TaxID=4796 RepID=A0A2P4XT58_9STRA|nr:Hypothetical protein PHPALM_15056 [Phytophthora palmivora]